MSVAREEPRNPVIVATVGLCGVGKSEAAKYLAARLRTTPIYFGGLVIEEMRRQGLAITTENERVVREDLRRRNGMAAVAQLAIEPIRSALGGRDVIVDGLYSLSEYEMLKRTFAAELLTIAIHTSKAIRYSRLAGRAERPLSRQEVDIRDHNEITNLEKAPPIVLADFHIVNEGSLEKLHAKLDMVLQGFSDARG